MLSQDAVTRCAAADARAELVVSLTQHLAAVNAKLAPHERLDCLAAVSIAWTPENGFVTPTLKVKRMRVEEAYADQYDDWLAQRKPVVWAS